MLTLIHGDNIVTSRNELVRLKESAKDKEIRDINGKNISESDLRQAVESLSLFGNTMLVVIEQLFSGLGKKEKLIKSFADVITNAGLSVDIVIWEPKELGKTVLGCFSKVHIQSYKTPAVIFEFLDCLKPGTQRNMLNIYDKTAEHVPVELILFMLQTRVRQLIQVKDAITPEKMSPWQMMRLTNQSKSFTMNKLLFMHTELLQLEFAYKTGATPFTLSELISQLIINL